MIFVDFEGIWFNRKLTTEIQKNYLSKCTVYIRSWTIIKPK